MGFVKLEPVTGFISVFCCVPGEKESEKPNRFPGPISAPDSALVASDFPARAEMKEILGMLFDEPVEEDVAEESTWSAWSTRCVLWYESLFRLSPPFDGFPAFNVAKVDEPGVYKPRDAESSSSSAVLKSAQSGMTSKSV